MKSSNATFRVKDYDLDATLASGQVFRWTFKHPHWTGAILGRWVQLRLKDSTIHAATAESVPDWEWLTHYLQLDLSLGDVLLSFPEDEPMRAAVGCCRGLRLLRQDPWECLASFILSSSKQIVQIQQIVSELCRHYGEPLKTFASSGAQYSFPSASHIAEISEGDLRACKMGFRAPYLLATARLIASGEFVLERLRHVPVEIARNELMSLPGVGRKVADCVLLFAYGFSSAFPIDVWVMKALRQLYFPRRQIPPRRLQRFALQHFGPHAGYAQQYLFHYMRTKLRSPKVP